MCVEQIRTLSEKEKEEKESLDVLNGGRRHCWLERVDSATESHFRWSDLSFTSSGRL